MASGVLAKLPCGIENAIFVLLKLMSMMISGIIIGYVVERREMSKELGSLSGRQEQHPSFFSDPYPVVKLHKDIIAVLAPEPYLFYSGTEKMGLCKACGSKLIKFYRKLVCSNCGNEYSVKNISFPIDKMARHTLTKVARHLANKERDHRRELIRLALKGGSE